MSLPPERGNVDTQPLTHLLTCCCTSPPTAVAGGFRLIDGKPLGALPLSNVTHLSDNGTIAAGIDPTGGNLMCLKSQPAKK